MKTDYQCFIPKTFRGDKLALIHQAQEIIDQYDADGYTLTLRQLYYQFVSRDTIENTDASYKRLGKLITDARQSGNIPWDGIEDRNREKKGWYIQEDVKAILDGLPTDFAADRWRDQAFHVEVWVEKEALSNVVRKACMPLRVPYMACKGYLSASEAYGAGQRMRQAIEQGKDPIIVHLGDHDPSGIDMTRDNQNRVSMFADSFIDVRRIALNRDQIDEFSPPPNPAKVTDSRAAEYIRKHGTKSWELDALEPAVVVDLITKAIEPLISDRLWAEAQERESEQRAVLRQVGERWDDIKDMLEEDL